MKFCVENPNNTNQHAPKNLPELVEFVEFVRANPHPIYVQISGYGEEVVEALALHFKVNFFTTQQMGSTDLNPFTIIYIDHQNEVQSRCINEKSKIVIYARRAIYNHH
jgi:hypothetical protein